MPDCRVSRLLLVRLATASLCVVLFGTSATTSTASKLRETPVVRAAKQVSPAVVNIHGNKSAFNHNDYEFADSKRRVNGMGTGVIIDPRGYIVTNHHVVDGVRRIQVTMSDGKKCRATLMAHDQKTDLAIIKISLPEELSLVQIGTSSNLMPGEPVIAVGNAYGYEHTVTVGIISALNRTVQISDTQSYANLIQTDASINPGNSGGPLLNIDGEVIGINVAVRVGAQGIGFALPIDDVMEVVSELISVKRLEQRWHGVVGQTMVDDGRFRFVVQSVENGSPASNNGLKSGDVISYVDGQQIERALDFERFLLGRDADKLVEIEIDRKGNSLTTSMKLASLPRRNPTLNDRAWRVLGLRLKSVPPSEIGQHNARYRGGLEVLSVRPGGPADKQGIRQGDILVGMHIWETISLDNVTYILNRKDLKKIQPVKFYVLRGKQTLYGHLQVSLKESQ